MSRTLRRKRPGFHLYHNRKAGPLDRKIADGTWQYLTASCQHNNACAWCRHNRTFANRRRAPIEDRV